MNEFCYYYSGVRQTSVDESYLQELVQCEENGQDIIQGILESKARWDKEKGQ